MSILNFMEMSILETLLYCLISFIICFIFSGIGSLFSPQKGVAVQTIIGMSFITSLIILCAAFCAGLSKYIIYGAAICSLILYIKRINKNKYKEDFLFILFVFAIFFFFFIHIFIWILPSNGTIEFNCHSTYFASVPLELLKADYFSRLRIIDVYPYEWGKYHFFNGAFTSIPLAFFFKKNYITFLFAKFLTISLFAGAIFEYLVSRFNIKKAVIYFFFVIGLYFTITFNLVTWSLYTNNYTCIFLFMLTWLRLENNNLKKVIDDGSTIYRESCIFSILFTGCASRSIIPGTFLFLFSLYKLYSENKYTSVFQFVYKEFRTCLFCLFLGFGILATVFSGINSATVNISFSITDFLNNTFHFGWMAVFPFGSFLPQLTIKQSAYILYFEFLILFIYLFFIVKNIKKYFNFLFQNIVLSILILVFIAIYFYGVYKISHISKKLLITTFLCIYLLPLSSIFFEIEDYLRIPFFIFMISTLFQFSILDAGVSFPNYYTIAILCIWLFAKAFLDMFLSKKNRTVIIYGFIFFVSIYIWRSDFRVPFLWKKDDVYHITLSLQNIPYQKEPFEYYTSNDADLAKLHALKGNRVHYNIIPSRSDPDMYKTSMSMSFLPLGYEEYGVLKINPQENRCK